jgi:hypothetical protein
MVVDLEPDTVSEAKVHDRIGDLARCRVRHHPFDPPESVAVRGIYGRSLCGVAGDQMVSIAIAGCCGSKALLGAHFVLLRQAEVDHPLFQGLRTRASRFEGWHEATAGLLTKYVFGRALSSL